MSSDGNIPLDELWDAVLSPLANAYNAWGWVVPATILTLLFCVLALAICWFLEDLPLEFEIIRTPFAIFGWTRKHWRETHWTHEKGTPDLVCLSLKANR